MKKLIILLLSAVLLTGCSAKTVTSDTNLVTNEAGGIAVAPAETDVSTNEAVAQAAGISNLANGGYDYCYVHSHSYHGTPGEFIAYVGQEAFNKYRETRTFFNVEKGETCTSTYTILDFLSYFNITKEEFYKIYNNSPCWYYAIHDADILYSGDTEKIEAFYKNIDYYDSELKWRNAEFIYKAEIRLLFAKEVTSTVNSDLRNTRMLSIVDLIDKSGVSEEDAIKMLGSVNERCGSNLNYDFDKAYNDKATLLSSSDPVEVDDSIRISK